jgi:diguanylate cyclase (GGDEF)-like protein/PAS domain S-box-containing protein
MMSPDQTKPSTLASYQDLFLRLLDSVLILDREEFTIIECNDATERLFETTTDTLTGKKLAEFIISEMQEEFLKKLRVGRRRYYPMEFETRLTPTAGKTLAIRMSFCSLKLSDNSEVLQVIARDITKEKEALEKIDSYMKELEVLNKKLEQLSITDELTRLHNVRHFKSRLKEEHDRAVRYKGQYSVILFDVDNFKHYNDTHGHPAGDQILRLMGQILSENTRSTDIAARYGGEEFVILCPEANWEGALIKAERFRKIIESFPFPHRDQQPLGKVSVSIGVASYPEDAHEFQAVVEAADQGLYHSKENGRNRTTPFKQIKDLPKKIKENK